MPPTSDLARWLAVDRKRLEQEWLPAFLPRQRWFGGKGRDWRRIELAGVASIDDLAHVLARVEYADGEAERYYVPLTLLRGESAQSIRTSRRDAIIAEIVEPGAAGPACLCDAAADPRFAQLLLAQLAAGSEVSGGGNRVHAVPTSAFAPPPGWDPRRVQVHWLEAEQSNTLLRLDQDYLLKIYRRVPAGVNPDAEIGRFLIERTRFRRVPALMGSVEYREADAAPATLAILQAWVDAQGDGWEYTLRELAQYHERVRDQVLPPEMRGSTDDEIVDALDQLPAPAELLGEYLQAMDNLGTATAELHLALASDPNDPDFAAEPLTPADLAAVEERIRRHWAEARERFRQSRTATARLSPRDRELIDRFLAVSSLPAFEGSSAQGLKKIRVHGDYHLGQLLRTADDWKLVDFEGEPSRPLAERRAKHCALKDVAGMVRSFSYAAHASLNEFAAGQADLHRRLAPWAKVWQAWVSAAFIRRYRDAAGNAPFVPADPHHFQSLLNRFILDKAMYELDYEWNHRPDWIGVPLQGVVALLNSGGRRR